MESANRLGRYSFVGFGAGLRRSVRIVSPSAKIGGLVRLRSPAASWDTLYTKRAGSLTVRAPRATHTEVETLGALYEGLTNPGSVGRYHSLTVREPEATSDFVVSAYTSQGEIMEIQFHPESVLTPDGFRLLGNFLDIELAFGSAQ